MAVIKYYPSFNDYIRFNQNGIEYHCRRCGKKQTISLEDHRYWKNEIRECRWCDECWERETYIEMVEESMEDTPDPICVTEFGDLCDDSDDDSEVDESKWKDLIELMVCPKCGKDTLVYQESSNTKTWKSFFDIAFLYQCSNVSCKADVAVIIKNNKLQVIS
jgi:uncharacterized protein YbaR (Trm112 family)